MYSCTSIDASIHVSSFTVLLRCFRRKKIEQQKLEARGGRRRRRKEEEGLFKADAVNEEDPERDRATQV